MTDSTASVAPDGDGSALDRRVRDAQTELLYRRSQHVNWAGAAFALLMAVGLTPYAPPELVWTWFALRLLVSIGRFWLALRYARSTDRGRPVWRTAFVAAVAVDALAWSAIGVWMIPVGGPTVASLLLTSLVGVSSVAIFVLESDRRASAAFLVGALVPLALMALSTGARPGFYAGTGLLVYVALMLHESRLSERRIHELLRLRFSTDRIAEERAEALRLAERQSSVKGQFLATMSHEMRTPLHGILGLTRALRRNAPDTAQLALIERAGEHLLTLINDALDFSRLEAGQVQLARQPFDLAALMDDVVSLSMPAATEAGLVLETRLHLPRPCRVVGDAARLRQILHNLVGNAVKFTDEGRITVVARYDAEAGRARFSVHDTGVGIAPEDLPAIFDAFHQADGSFKRRHAGTGLGLTIARELAQAMGGDLVASSEVGKGSVFTVKLDLPAAPEPAPVDVAATPVPRSLAGHVLLAEDNAVNALVAEAVLRQLGLEVTLVEDGARAVEAFRNGRPDLVLLDCQMPVMDGLEAARRIRAVEVAEGWPRTPMVALTANAFEGDRARSLAAGMDDHLAKPFRDEELARLLARHLGGAPAGDADLTA